MICNFTGSGHTITNNVSFLLDIFSFFHKWTFIYLKNISLRVDKIKGSPSRQSKLGPEESIFCPEVIRIQSLERPFASGPTLGL